MGEVTDRERWDAKHGALARAALEAPDAFVVAALERVEVLARVEPGAGEVPGRALDVAAGRGRHALELRARGYAVEAWDVSPVGLVELAECWERADADASASGRPRGPRARVATLTTRSVDLIGAEGARPWRALALEPFDLVLVAWFLHRPLIADLAALVRPGGVALVRTATVDRAGSKPPLAYCLERGELARGLSGFTTLWHEERDGRAGLLARRA